MQGYSYVGKIYSEIYDYLKKNGHYLDVLENKNLVDRIDDRFIQHICLAYLDDFEGFDQKDSLLKALIGRKNIKELNQLVWFIGTFGRNVDTKPRSKVYCIWYALIDILDLTNKEGRQLASSLCGWAVFIDVINDDIKDVILCVAPYADESHHA